MIGQTLPSFDPTGVVETYNLAAPTNTATNPFFQSLGTNGRACATCHEPRSAWGVSAQSIQLRFMLSGGTDPIFRVVDGATCSSDDVSTFFKRIKAYQLLLSKGLIRIFLPLPATQLGSNPPLPRDFEITAINDPYGCTDLSSTTPTVSVYRRPLPSANLRFLTECPSGQTSARRCRSCGTVGRRRCKVSQSTPRWAMRKRSILQARTQISQIVAFESSIFDAQEFDFEAGRAAFAWRDRAGHWRFRSRIFSSASTTRCRRDSIPTSSRSTMRGRTSRIRIARRLRGARAIFNTRQFTINGVNGLNLFSTDPLGATTITGTCTTCHDSPNVGNHSKKLPLNIGVADAIPPVLDVSGLPVFTVACTDTTGPLGGSDFQGDRSRQSADQRQLRGRRQGQGADTARIVGARALLSQRFGGDARGRREFLRSALCDRFYRAGQAGPGGFSQHALRAVAAMIRTRL